METNTYKIASEQRTTTANEPAADNAGNRGKETGWGY